MNTKPAFSFHKTGVKASAVLFLFSLLFLSAFRLLPNRKVEPGASQEDFTDYLNERIPNLMSRYDIPGIIVALVREGEPAWAGAYGYAELAAGRKMTTDTYCRVESISKPVTAWGVMKLVQEGKIELDAPVARYLKSWTFPESEFPVEEATVRQLLSHTAGLQLGTIGVRYDPKGEVPTLKEALTKDAHLMQAPGQGYSYSNT
ncbi:MAG: beta-lactamase family protein, partial [Phaeodactylibacter sp.]|nr:beta-lactamase family protein [Phaeodactylibacter sp.]